MTRPDEAPDDGSRALAHLLLRREVERGFRIELERQIERADQGDFGAILDGAIALQAIDDERAAAELKDARTVDPNDWWARSLHSVRAAIAAERIFAERAVRHLMPALLARE